jgi:hypothetical protein
LAGYAKAVAIAAVAVSSALIVSMFAIPSLNSPSPADNSTEQARRIVTITRPYEDPAFKHVKASDSGMEANSMQLVADPFGRSMRAFYDRGVNGTLSEEEKRSWLESVDAREKYMLVRLPEWLGGSANDLSAYRLFSALDIMSQCNIGYRDTRAVIEDPCHGNSYRLWDGLAVAGISTYGASGANAALFSPSVLALPQARIGVDSEGYIVAYRLDNTISGDGVVGEGKRFAHQELEQSNEKMLQAAGAHAGFELPFPAAVLGDRHLVHLVPWQDASLEYHFFGYGNDFEGHVRLFSAGYEPRPLLADDSRARFAITILPNEIGDDTGRAKATFDDLFGTESPECDQGCRFIVRQGDNMITRVDTEADANTVSAEALVWSAAGDRDVMVAIEGMNSSMEELLSVAAMLDQDL